MVLDSAQSAQVTNLAGQRNAGRWLTAHHAGRALPSPTENPQLRRASHRASRSLQSLAYLSTEPPRLLRSASHPISLHLSQKYCMPARAKNKEIV